MATYCTLKTSHFKLWGAYRKSIQTDFSNKSRKLGKIPDNAILVTADVVGLYPSIFHNVGLRRALKEALEKQEQKKFLQRSSCKWQCFFEFNNEIKQ